MRVQINALRILALQILFTELPLLPIHFMEMRMVVIRKGFLFILTDEWISE